MSRAHKLQLYRVLRYFLAECGWLMFIYEWIRVSHETPGKDQITIVFVLVPSLLLIHAGVSLWIAHVLRQTGSAALSAATFPLRFRETISGGS